MIDGRSVNDVSAADRGLAMVFQSYALYPHMTVYQNMSFGLENIGTPRARDRQQGQRGGEAPAASTRCSIAARRSSRAASASASRSAARSCASRASSCSTSRCPTSTPNCGCRCAARSPRCIERLASDDGLRHARPGRGDDDGRQDRRAARGQVEQVGTPLDLYNKPANRFVAGFIGSPQMNFVPVSVASVDGAEFASAPAGRRNGRGVAARCCGDARGGARAGRSSGALRVSEGEHPGSMPMRVEQVEQLGGHSLLYGAVARSRRCARHGARRGQRPCAPAVRLRSRCRATAATCSQADESRPCAI